MNAAHPFSSLYVHFPFCEAKCHYCDFYSLGQERTREDDPRLFEMALKSECEQWKGSLADRLDTVFFGGGTPSMTPVRSMERSLAPLQLEKRISDSTEWTMEANPSSVDCDRLKEYRSFGVNRISMGVQATRNDFLEKLGRVHSKDAAVRALEAIFEAGFDNVSVDLLCGVPGQSLEDIQDSLEIFFQYPISHLSCYLLTLTPGNRLYSQLPDEEEQLNHLLFLHEQMTQQGFEHYEISNFARPGKRARHNLAYWQGRSYLGLGPSAHSFSSPQQKRWKNISSLHRYAANLAQKKAIIEKEETLNEEQLNLEKWMLALRLSEGVPSSWLLTPELKAKAALFRSQGLLEPHPTEDQRIRLTPRGFALSDPIISAFATL